MGVCGLWTFIHNSVHGYRPLKKSINIEDEIINWKAEQPDQSTPLIVFDISGLRFSEKSLSDSSSNNREILEKFLKRLKTLDVKIVFFFDLDLDNKKTENWLKRRNEEFESKIDRYLFETKTTAESQYESNGLYSIDNFLSVLSKYGVCEFGVPNRDCDLDIARYANKKKAMAIFTRDTDFMIFDGNWKYWSIDNKDLDLEKCTTHEYDRVLFKQKINLTAKQLPLFATIMASWATITRISTITN